MVTLLKEMFSRMVEKKDAQLIPHYYHPEFICYTNEIAILYQEFLDSHIEYYATDIQYAVEYDEDAWVEQKDKLAGRVFITITKPEQPARRIEVILIASYKDNKLYRLWELTYPDWSKMETFTE